MHVMDAGSAQNKIVLTLIDSSEYYFYDEQKKERKEGRKEGWGETEEMKERKRRK